MTQQDSTTNAGLQVRVASATPPRQTPTEKRRQLVELEYGLRAMELHLGTVEEELKSLEGFSLTRLLAGIKGDRAERIQETRQRMEELRSKFDAAVANVEAMRQEVGELEEAFEGAGATTTRPGQETVAKPHDDLPAGPATTPESRGGTPAPQDLEARIRIIQRAIAAGDEARKGLLAELDTACRLGHCNVANANAVMGGLLGSAEGRARKDMGERIRADIRRFLRRFDEAVAIDPGSGCLEEAEVRVELERFADVFNAHWLLPNCVERGEVDRLLESFSLADMLLEKRLNAAKARP